MTTLWNARVRDYASTSLVSVLPETPLAEVHGLLLARDLSAVPVVDGRGRLRGILSTTDLLREARIDIAAPAELARITSPPRTAGDLMRPNVISIDQDAPLGEAAGKMMKHRIHCVVVTGGGAPVGVISTRDAMRAMHYHSVDAPLGHVMTSPVETIDEGDTIRTAIEHLDDANVRGLVVVDGSWPIGVFTHTEAIQAKTLPPMLLESPVERVMSYETICLDVNTPLYRVAGYAIEMGVRRILVVHNRELRGIVSGFDLVRALAKSMAS